MTLSAQVDFQKEEYGPPAKKKDTQDTLIWPERLTLRDTKVFADEGQRIFTTATGYGYEKQDYVIATALADRDAKIEQARNEIAERTKERDLARAEKNFWRTADANSVARAEAAEAQVADLKRERRELTQKLERAEAALHDEGRSVAIVHGNFKFS